MNLRAEREVPSPCVSVCVFDRPTGLCAGCYRTLDEIAGWIDLTVAERRAVLARVALRRGTHADAIASRLTIDAKR